MSVLDLTLDVPTWDEATAEPLEFRLVGEFPVGIGKCVARFPSTAFDAHPGARDWFRTPSGSMGVPFSVDLLGGVVTPWVRGKPLGSSVTVAVTLPRDLDAGESATLRLEVSTISLGNEDAVAGVVPERPVQEIADRYPNRVSGFRLWRAARAASLRGD